MTSERPFPPDLTYQGVASLDCGYSPRAIHLATDDQGEPTTLYVGCKDGSIWSIPWADCDKARELQRLGPDSTSPDGLRPPGVRSLFELSPHLLLVGRSNGDLEALDPVPASKAAGIKLGNEQAWLEPLAPEDPPRYGGSIRSIGCVDDERFFVSFRRLGTLIVHLPPNLDLDDGETAAQKVGVAVDAAARDPANRLTFSSEQDDGSQTIHDLPGLRVVVQLTSRSEQSEIPWLLATEEGDLFEWQGDCAEPASSLNHLWPDGERPVLVNDFALVRSRSSERIRGLFLATDRGVHLFERPESKEDEVQADEVPKVSKALRLSLPGLGSVCMALTYLEDQPPESEGKMAYRYLWAVDAEGDSHLYCDVRLTEHPNLRPSGFSHLGSQVLMAIAGRLGSPGDSTFAPLVCAQARRDDRVAIGRYRFTASLPQAGGGSTTAQDARQILSNGSSEDVLRFLADYEARRLPDGKPLWLDSLSDPDDTDLYRAARVSEFVQSLAESRETRRVLEEFLSNPSANDTGRFLDNIGPDEAARALDLWTVSFLGVINRYLCLDSRTNLAVDRKARRFSLGFLRWLGELESESTLAQNDGKVKYRFETCARMVRKWGLLGSENFHRRSLAFPIEVLRGGWPRTETSKMDSGNRVDLLTHEANLFNRGFDLVHEESTDELRGRSAWAVTAADLVDENDHTHTWIAVSWNWGGVEIFKADASGPLSDSRLELQVQIVPKGANGGESTTAFIPEAIYFDDDSRQNRAPIRRSKYGYCRAIHLGPSQTGKRLYLLSSPAFAREESRREALHLFVFRFKDGRLIGSAAATDSVELRCATTKQPGESIYSLLDVGDQTFVAGLRGMGGRARVQSFQIRQRRLVAGPWVDAKLAHSRPDTQDERRDPLGSERPGNIQNRVWSLAKPWQDPEVSKQSKRRGKARSKQHEVVLGCDNGEIWHLRWPRGKLLAPKDLAGGADAPGHFKLAARLGTPVQAIAYRKDYGPDAVPARIFAGGDDGSILAWQEQPQGSSREAEELLFTPLWATSEASPVAELFLWPYRKDDPKAPPVLVVAVCRNGFSILFDDRVGPHESSQVAAHPQRIQFPGNRHSRLRLGSTIFAAHLRSKENLASSQPQENSELLGVLVSATDRGTIRLLGFHHPRYTPERKKRYLDLVERWWSAARSQPGIGDIQYHLADAVYRAAPSLTLILIRWLLDPGLDLKIASDPDALAAIDSPSITEHWPARWKLPRYLRPLLDLRRAWTATPPRFEEVGAKLESALRFAREVGDVPRFQDISECAFKRANFQLFETALIDDAHRHENVQKLYFAVFEAIEQALEGWVGAPYEGERRTRVVVAKHLVDGDTFLRVLDRAALEHPEGQPDDEDSCGPFSKILRKRVMGVRQLIFKRDPIVKLEAIRASNLSMLRLCRRLVTRREDRLQQTLEPRSTSWSRRGCGGEGSPHEIRWEEFRLYFEQLTYAAAHSFQGASELGVALAHEYARTFALAVCACPSATIRIANRMTETRLITDLDSDQDLCHQVLRQMEILGSLGVPVPKPARRLFELVTRGPIPKHEQWFPARQYLADKKLLRKKVQQLTVEQLEKKQAPKIGLQNAQDVYCLLHLYCALKWLNDLSEAMASDATALDLSWASYRTALRHLNRLAEPPVRGLYKNSFNFWQGALESLEGELRAKDDAKDEPREGDDAEGSAETPKNSLFLEVSEPINPLALFASRILRDWAGDQLDALERRYNRLEIFQPEYLIFKNLLSRLKQASDDFPHSAAVQKAVVSGVLGHHLLEDLDEHVLELEEIAKALDPIQVRHFRDGGRRSLTIGRDEPMSRRFSTYLLRRALSAESMPKNLRMLYALLESRDQDDSPISLKHLLETQRDWNVQQVEWSPELPSKTAAHLALVFEELQQNHRKHSRISQAGSQGAVEIPPPSANAHAEGVLLRIRFSFEIGGAVKDHLGSVNYDRLVRLRDEIRLNYPISPSSNVEVSSSGTGLYLARLAAAAVGWRLYISQVAKDSEKAFGTCEFALERLENAGRGAA